jgi:hypothetical protein
MKGIKKGQGVVEVVFSIGVVLLILSGVVILMVNTFGAKNKGFDRKKATQLAQMIIEEKVAERDNSPETFWSNIENGVKDERLTKEDGFAGYFYNVTYIKIDDDSGRVEVEVGMEGRDEEGRDEKVTFERFFGRM